MTPDWLDLAGYAAAGGLGGMLYWSFAQRQVILARVKAALTRR